VTAALTGPLLLILGAYAATVAAWRAGLPPMSASGPGTAVVFFDGTVEATLPRALHALDFVRRGMVDRVLLVGGARPARAFFGSAVLRGRLSAMEGFGRAAWTADVESFDTPSNLRAAGAFLRAGRADGPVLFVSDDYHLWRIALTCRDPCDVPALAGRIVWSPTDEPRTAVDHLRRLIWEIGAWIAAALPEAVAQRMVWATRA
jgi:hypothetical protein